VGALNADRVRNLYKRLIGSKFVRDTAALQVAKLIVAALASLSYVITLRLLGPEAYGVFGLAQGLLALVGALDLTGIGTAATTRLGIAIGEHAESTILEMMAVFIRVSVIVNGLIVVFFWAFGSQIGAVLYQDSGRIGVLAAWLSLTLPADSIYALVTISLMTRRQMRALALLQVVNQLTLTVCIVVALVLSASAESLVVARLVQAYSTMLMAWLTYRRLRTQADPVFPPLPSVLSQARHVSLRTHLGFGFANAVDKTLGNLFLQIPQQMVGALLGERSAGYLISAINGISRLGLLTSAIFENMQAIIPRQVGAGDFVGLRRHFARVVLALAAGGSLVYGALAITAPWLVPLLLGEAWRPAIPALQVLGIFGAITTAGGVFGPLYRALDAMRGAIAAKLIALALALPLGAWLLSRGADGALVGAWTINLLFAISVGLTAWIALRALRRAAQAPSAPV
jgi:O-antigen/teichoic acid export membrane protein